MSEDNKKTEAALEPDPAESGVAPEGESPKPEPLRKQMEDLGHEAVGGVLLPEDEEIRAEIIQAIGTCYDPEIPVDVYQLGLIYRVDVLDNGRVEVDMTLTSPSCPAAQSLPAEVETKIRGVGGVSDVKIELIWEPTWGPQYMSEAAKLQLGVPS